MLSINLSRLRNIERRRGSMLNRRFKSEYAVRAGEIMQSEWR